MIPNDKKVRLSPKSFLSVQTIQGNSAKAKENMTTMVSNPSPTLPLPPSFSPALLLLPRPCPQSIPPFHHPSSHPTSSNLAHNPLCLQIVVVLVYPAPKSRPSRQRGRSTCLCHLVATLKNNKAQGSGTQAVRRDAFW